MQKLEDALIASKKHTSYRQGQLTKVIILVINRLLRNSSGHCLELMVAFFEFSQLYKCFLQVKDYSDKLKSCEEELQVCLSGYLEAM